MSTPDPWEYKVETFLNSDLSSLQGHLNRYGAEGWELVSTTSTVKRIAAVGNELVVILKRRGIGESPPDPQSGWG